MPINFSARFMGDDADKHMLPAFGAGQSLHGLSRSLTLIGHFMGTGEVRRRAPFHSGVQVYMHAPQAGSFETLFEFVSDPKVIAFGGAAGFIAGGIAANLATDFVRHIYRKVTGQGEQIKTDVVRKLDNERSGDVDALAEAVEPSLKLAHTVVGNGAQNIIIVGGTGNVVNFNGGTKQYLETDVTGDEDEVEAVSVGSYNVNSRVGRAFFHGMQRTVPFYIERDCAPGTVAAISYSLDQYAQGRPSDVFITFYRVMSADRETKRIVITRAWKMPA